jgi:hypothetical protein
MGEIADLMKNAGVAGRVDHPSYDEGDDGDVNVRYEEDIPGGYEDISGYDPLDYGDDDDDEDDGPDDIAEDTTNFATDFRQGPAIPEVKPQRQAQATTSQPEKGKKGNVHAELRIVQRENRIMQERFAKLLDAITNPQPLAEEEQEPEIVPFEQDPLTHMVSKLDAVSRKVDKQTLTQKQQQERERISGLLHEADNLTTDVANKIGVENWQDAMEYLADVRIEDYLERNPDRTRDEASQIIGAAVLREKVALTAAKKNPAELYLKDALRFGWRPAGQTTQAAQPVQQKAPVRTAKQEIRDANGKGQGTRTTASLNGAPAKQKLSAKAVVGMKENDFRDLVDDVMKERGRNGSLKLSDFISPNS